MKSILNLFRPSAKEEQLEAELSGKPSATSATSVQPPKRGASPASPTPTGAGAGELETLRASLASVEARLQAAHQERDDISKQFQSYRSASQADVRELESENKRLKESLNATSMLLSKQIAGSGLDGPIAEGGAEVVRGGDEIRGLNRAIQAAKAEAAATKFERIPRPTL